MSTVLWAGYVALVGALAAAAASIVEPVARALRWPTRALWAAALLAQFVALGWALAVAGAARPHGAFVGAWLLATAAAACFYVRSARLLRRERGRWRVTVAEEMPVWVSERTGPAVVGFLRSIVVAPEWAMAMRERERRLLLRHEAEHVAAWDPTLLLAGLVTCALVPWSPAAWWALARLRLAIEVDCDRRVLRAEPDVAAYGELLVAMSGRVEPGAATLAAFAERRLPLEERIEAMTARRGRGAGWRWAMRGVAAAALGLGACMVPAPRTTIVVIQPPTALPVAATPVAATPVAATPVAVDGGSAQGGVGGGGTPHADDALRSAQRQASALAFATLREHFRRADVARPPANHVAMFVLDEQGAIVHRRDVRLDSTFSLSADDLHERFPELPAHLRSMNAGVMALEDSTTAAAWWLLGDPQGYVPARGDTGDTVRTARYTRRALDAARMYVARQRPGGDAPLTIRVLFTPDWTPRQVTHGPLVGRIRADSAVASLAPGEPSARVLRGGILAAPADLGLPPGSKIVWAQLTPPVVKREQR